MHEYSLFYEKLSDATRQQEEGRARAERFFRNCLCLFVCVQIALVPGGAVAAEEGQYAGAPLPVLEQRVEGLTNDILHKEIDLERFYLQYRVLGTKEPRYRRLRYYLLQVASASCTLSANIVFLKLAADGLKPARETDYGLDDPHPQGDETSSATEAAATAGQKESGTQTAPEKNTDRLVKQGLAVGLVGTLLDVASSVVELSSNSLTAAKNVRKGRSPNAAVERVIARVKEIDTLSAEREAIIAAHPDWKAIGIYRAEGRVLKCFRDWCLSEFADVYADVKSSQASGNVYFLLDITADSIYLASYLYSFKSLDAGKGHLGGQALITGLVGDCFTSIAGPVSTQSYNWFHNHWRKKLQARLKESLKDAEADTKAEMKNLNSEIAFADTSALGKMPSVQKRVAAYLLWSERYDRYIDKQLVELRHQSKVALQGEISGPAIGATYLTQELVGTVAFFGYANKPVTAARLTLAGTIPITAGTSTSLALTNYNLFEELRHRRRLRRKNMLPEQLLADRLKTLDELDAMLPPLGKAQ